MSKRKSSNQEAERLASQVRMDGKGEDPVVKALLSDKFVEGTNQEALDISLALQQLIRGNASLLENQEKMSQEISRLKSKMNKMDKAAEAWEADKVKFAQEVFERAERLKVSGHEKDKLVAGAANEFQQEVIKARAELVTDNMQFAERIRTMPRVKVISAGVWENVKENGQFVQKLVPEVIRIKNRQWVLPIGQEVEVPQAVADRIANIRSSNQEDEERKTLLSGNLEDKEVNAKWAEINRKSKSKADSMPVY